MSLRKMADSPVLILFWRSAEARPVAISEAKISGARSS
jgi:hypothetical protein